MSPVLRALSGPESFRRVPWKNGLGTTLELGTDRAPADDGPWAWRLSLADVPTAGPFSHFPGVDRQLACLDGAGLFIVRDGAGRIEVPRVGPAVCFPGEAEVRGEPVGAGVRDANLMLRRGVFTGALTLLRGGSHAAAGAVVLVYAAGPGAVGVASNGSREVVPAGHLLRVAGPCTVLTGDAAVAVVAELRPVAAGPSPAA